MVNSLHPICTSGEYIGYYRECLTLDCEPDHLRTIELALPCSKSFTSRSDIDDQSYIESTHPVQSISVCQHNSYQPATTINIGLPAQFIYKDLMYNSYQTTSTIHIKLLAQFIYKTASTIYISLPEQFISASLAVQFISAWQYTVHIRSRLPAQFISDRYKDDQRMIICT